ncbi:MAG: tetratricopeptide repeat protein [Pseudomonadota bacterium]
MDTDEFLIREVKAELERERMETIWKRYGTYIISAVALLVVSVAGYQYWKASTLAANQKAGAAYDQALSLAQQQKYDEAATKFKDVADSSTGGYSVLSQLQLAATFLDQKKPDEAIAAFEKAATSGGEKVFTDFARLQLAALKMGTADFTETENRLNGLISDENPWRFSAQELLGLAQLRSGRTEEARSSFQALLGEQAVPSAMQNRIQVLLAQMIANDVKAEAATKTDTEGLKSAKPASSSDGTNQTSSGTVSPKAEASEPSADAGGESNETPAAAADTTTQGAASDEAAGETKAGSPEQK